jgi:hypothetical protein
MSLESITAGAGAGAVCRRAVTGVSGRRLRRSLGFAVGIPPRRWIGGRLVSGRQQALLAELLEHEWRRGDAHANPPWGRGRRGGIVESIEGRHQDGETRPSKSVLPPVLEAADHRLVDMGQPFDLALGQVRQQAPALQPRTDQVVPMLFDLVTRIRRMSPAWRPTLHPVRLPVGASPALIWEHSDSARLAPRCSRVTSTWRGRVGDGNDGCGGNGGNEADRPPDHGFRGSVETMTSTRNTNI